MIFPAVFDGINLKFSTLTIEQEDEWADETRDIIITEAQRIALKIPQSDKAGAMLAILAEKFSGQCGFMGDVGKEQLKTELGLARALHLAARKEHSAPPAITLNFLRRFVREQPETALTIVIRCIPISNESRDALLSAIEKKIHNGQMDGHSSPPTKSDDTSATSLGVSPSETSAS